MRTRFGLYTPSDFSFEFAIAPKAKVIIPKQPKIQPDMFGQMRLFEVPVKIEKQKRRQRKVNIKTNFAEKKKFKQLSLGSVK